MAACPTPPGWLSWVAGITIHIIPTILKSEREDSLEIIGAEMGDLYALDFDGVLCDSCGESSLSAVKVLPPLSSFLPIHFLYNQTPTSCPIHQVFFAWWAQAAKVRWPSLFTSVDSATEDWIVEKMHIVIIFPSFPQWSVSFPFSAPLPLQLRSHNLEYS